MSTLEASVTLEDVFTVVEAQARAARTGARGLPDAGGR